MELLSLLTCWPVFLARLQRYRSHWFKVYPLVMGKLVTGRKNRIKKLGKPHGPDKPLTWGGVENYEIHFIEPVLFSI